MNTKTIALLIIIVISSFVIAVSVNFDTVKQTINDSSSEKAETINFMNKNEILELIDIEKTNDVSDVLKLALSGKIQDARNKMIELIKVYGMSESDFLKYINQALFAMKTQHLEDASQIIAKYDFRILSGSNPEIQLTAMLAELSKFSK